MYDVLGGIVVQSAAPRICDIPVVDHPLTYGVVPLPRPRQYGRVVSEQHSFGMASRGFSFQLNKHYLTVMSEFLAHN